MILHWPVRNFSVGQWLLLVGERSLTAKRFRHLVSLVEELSFSTVRARLIACLVRLAEGNGPQTSQGRAFCDPRAGVPQTHRLIGNRPPRQPARRMFLT
jgi:hypothetical protein